MAGDAVQPCQSNTFTMVSAVESPIMAWTITMILAWKSPFVWHGISGIYRYITRIIANRSPIIKVERLSRVRVMMGRITEFFTKLISWDGFFHECFLLGKLFPGDLAP